MLRNVDKDDGVGLGLVGGGAYGSLSLETKESDQAAGAVVKIQPALGGDEAIYRLSESKVETHQAQGMGLEEKEVDEASSDDMGDGDQFTSESRLLSEAQAQDQSEVKAHVIEVAEQPRSIERIERSKFQQILQAIYELFDSTATATFILGPVGEIYALSTSCVGMSYADFFMHRFFEPGTTHIDPVSVYPSKGEIFRRLTLAGVVAGAADCVEVYADPRIAVWFVQPFGKYVVCNYMAHGSVTFALVKTVEAFCEGQMFAANIKGYEQNPSKKQQLVKCAGDFFRDFSQAEMLRTLASYAGSSFASHPLVTLGAEVLRELVGYLTTPVKKSVPTNNSKGVEASKQAAKKDDGVELTGVVRIDTVPDAFAKIKGGDEWSHLDDFDSEQNEKATSSSAKMKKTLRSAFDQARVAGGSALQASQNAFGKMKSAGGSAAKAGKDFAKKAGKSVRLATTITALAISSVVAKTMQDNYKKDDNSLGQRVVSDAVTLASFWLLKDCLLPAGWKCLRRQWKERQVKYIKFVDKDALQKAAESAAKPVGKPG